MKSPPGGEAGALGGKKLIIISGLPGTGKTTVAKILADFLNCERLSTDDIRKEKGFSIRKKYGDKPYPENHKKRTYDTMFDMAEEILDRGGSVILDATFYTRTLRDRAQKLAEGQDAKFIIIEVTAKEELITERIEERFKKGTDSSEANKKIYYLYKSKFEPIEEEKIVIKNDGSFKDLENKIKKLAKEL